jgi:hypothetical protein
LFVESDHPEDISPLFAGLQNLGKRSTLSGGLRWFNV